MNEIDRDWSETQTPPRLLKQLESDRPWGRRIRITFWGLFVVIFAAYVALWRVHTYLGVKAVAWDKNGREYVWRVWWRARNDMIGSGPATPVVVVYFILIALFLILSIYALWLALVPDDHNEAVETPVSSAAFPE